LIRLKCEDIGLRVERSNNSLNDFVLLNFNVIIRNENEMNMKQPLSLKQSFTEIFSLKFLWTDNLCVLFSYLYYSCTNKIYYKLLKYQFIYTEYNTFINIRSKNGL
jgi:hypothetical protein